MVAKYELYMEAAKVTEEAFTYKIGNTHDVATLLMEVMKLDKRTEERFVVIGVDSKGNVIGFQDVSIGGGSYAYVEPPNVMKFLLLSNSQACIVAHNHPSGDVDPSPQDMEVTNRLSEACKLMGIRFLDHFIVGNGKSLSLREEGLI